MRPKATALHFLGYTFDAASATATFAYQIRFSNRAPLDFTETITLPSARTELNADQLARFLEPLHLILGISYYKIYCPPKIVLPFRLSRAQADFWNTVYRKGLGEFLYVNKLSSSALARFPHGVVAPTPARVATTDAALLGIGGGKDSIVAAELLKELPEPLRVSSFLVETQRRDPIARRVMGAIGFPAYVVRRTLDPKLFQLHEGAYNGHIPVSAVFAFIGLFAAASTGRRYVIVGNEVSSNAGNLTWRGEMINHQWSKSAEFEALLQDYTRRFISPDVTYFSLLRQFYEIRVVEQFSKHPRYFRLFTSCNRSFRVHKERPGTLWCGACPKCAYVFLILAPFLPKKTLIGIFGKDLLADAALLPLYADVLGFGTAKPFDCVGTFEEAQAALFLAAKTFPRAAAVNAYLRKVAKPAEKVRQVFRTVPAPTLPTPFRFAGMRSVVLLGYGKEGKVSERYLKKFYPQLTIGVLDEARDPRYLEKQHAFDLAVKTPGIPKRLVTIPYVTATNLFFSRVKNTTVGVTGTKGKSTTTALIHDMLAAGGRKVRQVGNNGRPMLEVLLGRIDPDEIFVVELSSYMLDDILYSPRVALLLNLFPEHMNYHGGVAPYYAAKQHIFTFQKPGDVALRPPFPRVPALLRTHTRLAGEHNRKNILAAAAAARVFKVPEAAMRRAVRGFTPLPHRLENVGTYRGITFYDDAISTTPESTIAALRAIPNVRTIFLGGLDRGYDFRALEKELRRRKVKNVVLFPDSGKRILRSRKGFTVLETRSMKAAVAFAYAHTPAGAVCLLSTASPSYSVWKNFEEKGDMFKRYVRG
ncbi:hypothetical protein EPO33_05295 [Patescibacteria group bacterium]|nr:MAG: hypothetical protein EPO33_05295 [Patescibacteria group bacterium]